MSSARSTLLPVFVLAATAVDATVVNVALPGSPPYESLVAFAVLFVFTYVALAGACRYAARARLGGARTPNS